jgi:adenylate cyclase
MRVQCAVDLQDAMSKANGGQPNECQILLRIGVNLGDVVVEGSDLYGDGINIATRLEQIAEPGGVLVSDAIYSYVKNKVKVSFEDLGCQELKNIAEPIRVHRITGTPRVAIVSPQPHSAKPSIAVLPFTNMSSDPDQQYLSDGITEDFITELSRFHGLLVNARNSSFQFRDKTVDVRRVGRELGVHYVVEGSVRKVGNNVRVAAQLIDAATGNHVWAERYDRTLDDIFRVQDEVVRNIAARVEGQLATNVAEQARRKPTQNMVAYEYVLRAREHLGTFDWWPAEPLLRQAVQLDPNYAQAHAWLSKSIVYRFFFDLQPKALDEALDHALRAVSFDERDAECHVALAQAYLWRRQFERAGVHYQRGVALNPADVNTLAHKCRWLISMGQQTEALVGLNEVLSREPFPPSWHWEARSIALFASQRWQDTIDAIGRMSRLHYYNHAYLAACHAKLGNAEEAQAETVGVMRLKPDFTITRYMLTEPFKDPADAKSEIDNLRSAGLPL